MTAHFVLYRRVSTDEQGKSGLGLDAQQRDFDLFLSVYAGEGSQVVASFVEVHSAADDMRPQLAAALDVCRRTKATLLVQKLDRLSRRVSFIASLMEDKRLAFKVAQMPHADKFQLHIYAALAEQERDFISHRTKAALREAKARGVKLGGLRDTTNARNKALSSEAIARAEALRPILAPMASADATLQAMADALQSAGVKTARGGDWTPKQVSRVLERLDL